MGIKKHFLISIASHFNSLPLKQMLGETLKGPIYILGGQGVLPYKK